VRVDGTPTVLVLISPGCSMCETLIIGLKTLSRRMLNVRWAVLAFGEEEAVRATRVRHKLNNILVCRGSEEDRQLLKCHSTPYALLIDPHGRVASKGIVNHIEHLESLVELALAEPVPQGGSHD